jgi:hypothetical protein
MAGYHVTNIPRGEYGELSKIQEELLEAIDSEHQGVKLMVAQELSDIIGAIQGYLAKHMPDTTLTDLVQMSEVTQRAFKAGGRTPKPETDGTGKYSVSDLMSLTPGARTKTPFIDGQVIKSSWVRANREGHIELVVLELMSGLQLELLAAERNDLQTIGVIFGKDTV